MKDSKNDIVEETGTLNTLTGEDELRDFVKSIAPDWETYVPWSSHVKGIRVNFLGASSLLPDISFADLFAKLAQLELYRKYAVYGATVAVRETRTDSFIERYPSMSNQADLIIINTGSNDFGDNVPLGAETGTDTTTYYGALNRLCDGLQNKYPDKQIIFMTPFPRNTDNLEGLRTYVDALIKVCRTYRIPIVNLYDELGFNPLNAAQRAIWLPDGLHVSAKGHLRIAIRLLAFVHRYYL